MSEQVESEAVESPLPFYLRDVHAPVPKEVEAFDLPTQGSIPPEIHGFFVRNGPNPLRGDPGHWFLGDGMLHGVHFEHGQAKSYRNRFVKTRALTENAQWMSASGQLDFTAGVANTHVISHGGKILALVENGFPWEVDENLETIGYHDFGGALQGAMTAHPKICPKTGELHFFGYHFAPPYVTYHRADAQGKLVLSRSVELPRPVMMHDFAVTQDYVIWMDLPIVFSAERALAGRMPYAWDDEAGARLGFMRRDDPHGEIVWLEIDPCYVFHPMNAWNEGNRIVLDVARYDDLWRQNANSFEVARLHRFEIDLEARKVAETPLDDLGIEFPRLRESLNCLPNRYGYAVWNRTAEGTPGQGLVRYDLENGTRDGYDGGDSHVPSEAVFVPASETGDEGEGWLLAYFYDRAREGSELAIFDATHLPAGPIARVELPQRVPMGFHGSWIPREA